MSLAIGMAGRVTALLVHANYHESAALAAEYVALIESIGDPNLVLQLVYAAIAAKFSIGEVNEVLRLAQWSIDLAEGDPHKGDLLISSPLLVGFLFRGLTRCALGQPEWQSDIDYAVTSARTFDANALTTALLYKYGMGVANGCLLFDEESLRETAEGLRVAERSGDDFAVASAHATRGITLLRVSSSRREEAIESLLYARRAALAERFTMAIVPIIDAMLALEKVRQGEIGAAIDEMRAIVEGEFASGHRIFRASAVTSLVELLLQRGTETDLLEAQTLTDRMAQSPVEAGVVLNEVAVLHLRALLAKAQCDAEALARIVGEYRAKANAYGYQGHLAIADALMPP